MTDTFEFTLNNPLTEEQWDMITDVDMERTDRVTFRTKHGKEVAFAKVRHGKWIDMDVQSYTWKVRCSVCGHERSMMSTQGEYPKYCEECGARMDEDNVE